MDSLAEALQGRIGYQFRDTALLQLALTHPSMPGGKNNQRLEFLGDAVLGATIASLLYDEYPQEKEGELARRQAALVRGETLTQIAQEIALGEALHIGVSERQSQGRQTASNLEDALEALIGALYKDGGGGAAEAFIRTHWLPLSKKVKTPPKDAKTALQEWAQARGLPVPTYHLAATTGSAHAPLFTIEVAVEGYAVKSAEAPSKRMAEQTAAGLLLEALSHA